MSQNRKKLEVGFELTDCDPEPFCYENIWYLLLKKQSEDWGMTPKERWGTRGFWNLSPRVYPVLGIQASTGSPVRLQLWALTLSSHLPGRPSVHHGELHWTIPRPQPPRFNPDSLATLFSQPQRGGPDTWLKSFKTAFPKYLSDWQMEMLYAGAGGERIGNKTKDARESINSVGGHDGAWRCVLLPCFWSSCSDQQRGICVFTSSTPHTHWVSSMGQALGWFITLTRMENH